MAHLFYVSHKNEHEHSLFGRLSSNIIHGPWKWLTIVTKLSSQNTAYYVYYIAHEQEQAHDKSGSHMVALLPFYIN